MKGDKVLINVAETLKHHRQIKKIFARITGDTFVDPLKL